MGPLVWAGSTTVESCCVMGALNTKYPDGICGQPCLIIATDWRPERIGSIRLLGKPRRSGVPSGIRRRSEGYGIDQNVDWLVRSAVRSKLATVAGVLEHEAMTSSKKALRSMSGV